MQILDEVGNREDNAQLLAEAMDKAMKQNPLKFFMQVMAPLLPREALLKVESKASCGPWVTLVEVARYREIEKRAQEAGLELPPPAVLHHRNGGPPPCWPSPPRPPDALPPITAREPGRV